MKEKDNIIDNFMKKVKDCENNVCPNVCLNEKNEIKKKTILERLVDLEKINGEKEDKINIITSKCKELEDKLNNQCRDADKETEVSDKNKIESDINKQAMNSESLNCDYCDFIGKTEGGLKTHMRFKHTKILHQLNWKHCTFCNFNCKTDTELNTHLATFKSTHNEANCRSTQNQFNSEISTMCDKGFILKTFDSANAQDYYLDQYKKQNK